MIIGALNSSNVHQQSLARYVESPNPKAALRKVERFFVKKNYLPRIMQKPSLIFLDLRENLISVLIDRIGNLGIKTSTTQF